MTGRRAIVDLCVLCALLVSAFAAQGASAATNGTTGTAGGTPYSGAITGAGGETFLHTVISGVEMEFRSTEFIGSGEMESMLAESGEHTSNGTGTAEYKNVTIVKPSGKGCKVKTGEVKTNKLKATTTGQGMGLKFEPSEGTTFAKFEVEGCSIAALNGSYEFTGSVVGEPVGTELIVTRAGTTAQNTLKLRGQKSGLAGAVKLKTAGGAAIEGVTVETP